MIEYRATVFVGMINKTWYEVECTYLAADDEGDVRAIEAMEHQVLSGLTNGAFTQVAFVLLSPTTLEVIEDVDDEGRKTFNPYLDPNGAAYDGPEWDDRYGDGRDYDE